MGMRPKRGLFLLLAVGSLFLTGCRRPPAEPTLRYAREEAALAEAAERKKLEQREFLSDRYAWQGRTTPLETLPCRLIEMHSRYTAEYQALHTLIHSRPKPK